jgi:hypothetical protein
MPLTDRVLSVVINALECVDIGPKRRRAFDALRPLLNLNNAEMDSEFARVEDIMRYVAESERDRAALTKVHMHKLPCRVQARFGCRHLV